MRLMHHLSALILALAVSSGMMGCARNVMYDPFWHDYHRWSGGEDRRYREWEASSNRTHVDFPDQTPGDQLAYWSWRHSGSSSDQRYSRRGHR